MPLALVYAYEHLHLSNLGIRCKKAPVGDVQEGTDDGLEMFLA